LPKRRKHQDPRRSLLATLMAKRAMPSPLTRHSPQRRPCSPPSRAATPTSEISHLRYSKTPRQHVQ
jgi:hypothetical protein